jgi:diguanylate cyclase (GGDEF)-like protein
VDRGHIPIPRERQPIRILVVDDSEDDAHLLYSELTARGERIDYRRVDDAPAMAAAINVEDWDVIICDHRMPRFDSAGALEVLKQSGKDVPFIIYSGTISDRQAVSAMCCGVSDYIEKGNFDRLVPVIEREVRGALARSAVRRADDRIKRLAYYDSLSDLPNHDLFCRRVQEHIDESRMRGKDACGALYVLNVDRFLRIKSAFGYESGTAILKQLARRLAECAEQTAIVARLGTEQFGIFNPHVVGDCAASDFAQWVLKVFDAPFSDDNIDLYLTSSIGVALVPADGMDVYELLTKAEAAMAAVKLVGGNGCRRYEAGLGITTADRLTLEGDLQRALGREELSLHFQPIIDAADGKTVAVEALPCWVHPTLGLFGWDSLKIIAEESGLAARLGEWVLLMACKQGQIWHDMGFNGLNVSVAVSPVRLVQSSLPAVVSEALGTTGFRPECLDLAFAGPIATGEGDRTDQLLRALKRLGVNVSIDEFGSRNLTVSHLRNLPIDSVRIDCAHFRRAGTDREDDAIIGALMALAKGLRVSATAKGLETQTQHRYLLESGCAQFQGDFLCQPLEADAVPTRLLSEASMAARAVG